MTAVARVVAVVVVHMAGNTFSIVVPIKAEVLFVRKGGRQPGLLHVALPTVAVDFSVQGIARAVVAAVALFPQIQLQQLMRELADWSEGPHALVIAVAGDAILLDQLLMEGNVLLLLGDGQPLGRLQADLRDPVTSDVLLAGLLPKNGVWQAKQSFAISAWASIGLPGTIIKCGANSANSTRIARLTATTMMTLFVFISIARAGRC